MGPAMMETPLEIAARTKLTTEIRIPRWWTKKRSPRAAMMTDS